MKRILLSLFLVLASVGVCAQTSPAAPHATAASSPLIGTWRLISAGNVYKDGRFEPFPEYGPHPIGYLMYDITGHIVRVACQSEPSPLGQ